MPIIHLANEPILPPGAKNLRGSTYGGSISTDQFGPHAYWTYETHHGLCIRDSEQNGYNDSDFYMLVWDEEKGQPESICFATTRGWSYPCYGSSADATPETLMKYEAWCKARQRRYRIQARWDERAKLVRAAKLLGCSRAKAAALQAAAPSKEQFNGAIRLVTSSLRSTFRISLRQQLTSWLAQGDPKYPSPFSRKQWEYV